MQFTCIKKKSELAAKQKKEAKEKVKSQAKTSNTPLSEKKKETPVFSEYQKSSPSLKNISPIKQGNDDKEAKIEDEKTFDTSNRPSQIFSEDELKTAWLRYAEINKERLPRLYQVLLNHIPQKLEENKIIVLLDSETQKKDFIDRIYADLTGFLKEELSNFSLVFNVDLSKEIESKNLIYTAADKFKYLAEINPELEVLKKKFNLDFE